MGGEKSREFPEGPDSAEGRISQLLRDAYSRRRAAGDLRSHQEIADASMGSGDKPDGVSVKTARRYAQGLKGAVAQESTVFAWMFGLRKFDASKANHDRENQEILRALEAARDSRRKGASRVQPDPSPSGHQVVASADLRAISAFAPAALIGRDSELAMLHQAWNDVMLNEPDRRRLIVFHALGGEGKTCCVARWCLEVASRAEPGSPPIVAWSFYHQGTGDRTASHSNAFLVEGLRQLGDHAAASAPTNDTTKAQQLLKLVIDRRALLVLDGLEPLQYPPGPSMQAAIKDDALKDLLFGLSLRHRGLCIVTTRYRIADLDHEVGVLQYRLPPLAERASIELLRSLHQGQGQHRYALTGTHDEFVDLARWSAGHALTLSLIGGLLLLAYNGDLRMRDQVTLRAADDAEELARLPTGRGHAWRVIDAYSRWFEEEGAAGRQAIALLLMLGLFDRRVPSSSLTALIDGEPIPGLTEAFGSNGKSRLDIVAKRLETLGLITCLRELEAGRRLIAIDVHPLIREYFADRLRQQPDQWCAAHKRLFDHLRTSVDSASINGVLALEPLYQAIEHGCKAGLYQAAFKVFMGQIACGNQNMSTSRFGAINNDIACLASFFSHPWKELAPGLKRKDQMKVASLAGFRLRSASRFGEARELMKEALAYYSKSGKWKEAADEAGNLSVLCMHAGRLKESEQLARRAVSFAERNAQMVTERLRNAPASNQRRKASQLLPEEIAAETLIANRLATLGDPLVQMGPCRRTAALEAFTAAEAIQSRVNPGRRFLHSTKGYRYHELLLDMGKASEVLHRAKRIENWTSGDYELLDRGQLALIRARAYLLLGIRHESRRSLRHARNWIDKALEWLRTANFQESVVYSLLIRAQLDQHDGLFAHAREALDTAWFLAGRGPLVLFQIDILLARVRLFCRSASVDASAPYPWHSPVEDLKQAVEWIEASGYGRRRSEASELQRDLAELSSAGGGFAY